MPGNDKPVSSVRPKRSRSSRNGKADALLAFMNRLAALNSLDEQLEARGDGRVGEHREAFEVQGLGDVLEALVQLADAVVVRDEDVVEEH